MSKAVQGFSPEAYFLYVEGGNPRRTPLIGKIAIYGWKLIKEITMSQGVLAIAEQVEGVFRKITYEALSEGRRIADRLNCDLAPIKLLLPKALPFPSI